MKVYVVKRNDGKYLSKNYNYNYNLKNPSQTSWTENILNARTYKDKYDADNFCNTVDCQIVECFLVETKELADYTKQVRKEVCDEIRKEFFRNCIGAGETEEEQIYYITRIGLKKLLGE